ncbi:MAG: long-chain-fatty-acid--CoA ligase [Actinomycetota bacterium]
MTSSLSDLVRRSAERRPEKTALIFGASNLSYELVEERVRLTAGVLHDLGVRKGDRVALLVGNVPEFVYALHGALRIGAVACPLNVMLTPEEVGYMLADAEAKVVVVEPPFAPTVLAVRDRLDSVEQILVTARPPIPSGTLSWDELIGDASDPPQVEVGADDVALITYTAGTSANPKGAVLTHGNLLANLAQISAVPALMEAESDIVLLALPLFHIYALNVVLGVTFREAATAVLVERFDPTRTLELVEEHRVSVLFGAPPMFQAWLQTAGERDVDLSSVRLAVSGAAALPAAVLRAFRDRFGITIWEGYGLTETAPAVTTNALGPEAKADSIGLALPGVDVRLVDEDGEDVEEGDPGEIVLRGPNVFGGYWNKPELNDAAFRDGWFRTGDVAYRDEDGYLFLVDRKKDLIIVSGFNVYPKEVEEAIASHPGVAECAVISVPDERTGEAVKALVVPTPGATGATPTQEEILEHCRGLLARFKLPREIDFVEALPKHATGKVVRRALRELG